MSGSALTLPQAAAILRRGGLIAYPTEAVWGLGCDPLNAAALQRLLQLKQRPEAKGMIVIAADLEQALPWLDWAALEPARQAELVASWPGPTTWLVPCRDSVPPGLRGAHDTLAVRITAHPVAAALCRAFGGPVVSTSANRAGHPAARRLDELEPAVLAGIDGVVPGQTGERSRPSTIRDARTGAVIRPG